VVEKLEAPLRLPDGANAAGPNDRPTATRLELLGGFFLRHAGRPAHVPHNVQRLLAFLSLQRRPLGRAFVSGRLWPDLSQEHAFGCLRTTLWRMGAWSDLVETTTRQLALSSRVEVDAAELETCADVVLRRGGAPEAAEVHRLVHAAELLPGWYDSWVLEERDRLAQLRMLALETAADELTRVGAYRDAALAATAAVRADPLRESAVRLLIRLHLAAGNPVEAVREFRAYRKRLGHDLGLQPSARILALIGTLA
jgi:DNA-binding SARP family transcriptional activator